MNTLLLSPKTLNPNPEFSRLADDDQVAETARALQANGMQTFVVETGQQAVPIALGLIPAGAKVYNPPSRTLEQIGLTPEIEASSQFQPVRNYLKTLDRVVQQTEYRRAISSCDVVIGSVHAITGQGQVLIASASGTQLGPAVFSAGKVIWIVGAQKLVHTLDEGFRRIQEYSYPLEDRRTRQAYNQPSAINKVLIVDGELPGRITIILVKQNLGF